MDTMSSIKIKMDYSKVKIFHCDSTAALRIFSILGALDPTLQNIPSAVVV